MKHIADTIYSYSGPAYVAFCVVIGAFGLLSGRTKEGIIALLFGAANYLIFCW